MCMTQKNIVERPSCAICGKGFEFEHSYALVGGSNPVEVVHGKCQDAQLKAIKAKNRKHK